MGSKFRSQARALESLITSQVFLLKEGKVQTTACEEISDSRVGATTETVKWSTRERRRVVITCEAPAVYVAYIFSLYGKLIPLIKVPLATIY